MGHLVFVVAFVVFVTIVSAMGAIFSWTAESRSAAVWFADRARQRVEMLNALEYARHTAGSGEPLPARPVKTLQVPDSDWKVEAECLTGPSVVSVHGPNGPVCVGAVYALAVTAETSFGLYGQQEHVPVSLEDLDETWAVTGEAAVVERPGLMTPLREGAACVYIAELRSASAVYSDFAAVPYETWVLGELPPGTEDGVYFSPRVSSVPLGRPVPFTAVLCRGGEVTQIPPECFALEGPGSLARADWGVLYGPGDPGRAVLRVRLEYGEELFEASHSFTVVPPQRLLRNVLYDGQGRERARAWLHDTGSALRAVRLEYP